MSDGSTHEAVVASLMDLQARLRGDGGEDVAATQTAVDAGDPQDLVRVPDAMPIFVNVPEGPLPSQAPEMLSVVEGDVVIEVAADEDQLLQVLADDEEGFAPVTPLHPDSTAPTDSRLTALTDRLARLESELEGVIGRIEKVDPAKGDSYFTDLQHSIDERLRGTEA
jgi:hypothetical protein